MRKRDWRIRQANIEDAPDLKRCMESAYAVYQDRMGGGRLPPMDTDYDDEIRSFPVWVAESKQEIVGGLVLMFEESYATLANIAVHPDFQGHGLGRGLLEFAETEAKRRGHAELRLATHVLLSENISLYLHFGWSEMDRDDIRVRMRKQLDT